MATFKSINASWELKALSNIFAFLFQISELFLLSLQTIDTPNYILKLDSLYKKPQLHSTNLYIILTFPSANPIFSKWKDKELLQYLSSFSRNEGKKKTSNNMFYFVFCLRFLLSII